MKLDKIEEEFVIEALSKVYDEADEFINNTHHPVSDIDKKYLDEACHDKAMIAKILRKLS